MNWNTWAPIIVLIIFLVFCCGPMIWMMAKRGDKSGKETKTKNQNGSDQP